jgi:hypothetical protein
MNQNQKVAHEKVNTPITSYMVNENIDNTQKSTSQKILNEKVAKKEPSFYCESCDYICRRKNNFNKHLTTSKHIFITKVAKVAKSPPKIFLCSNCNVQFKSNSGLWYHKSKCVKNNESLDNTESNEISLDITGMNNESLTKMVIENIRENREFQKQMFELLKDNMVMGSTTNNINSHNKTMNNNFNLNFFLNETCKDAMNINDFIDYVTVNLDDFENFGKVGYPKALGEIIVRNLNELDVKIRPIHCSDLKREVLHVKHDGVWHSDDSQKFIKRSITYVANKNIRQRPLWQDENPESKNCLSTTYERFNNICLASLGPATDEQEADFLKKITSTIARQSVIDKKKKY